MDKLIHNIIKFKIVIICICKLVVLQKQTTECPHPEFDNKKYEEHSNRLGCNIGKEAGRLYHCVLDGTDIRESCQKEFECPEGTYLTVSSTVGLFTCSECPKGTFYPSKRNSSKALKCHDKHTCDSDHNEQVCDEGSSKEDRTCKCMYREGYRMLLQSCAEEKCCSRKYCSPCYCEHVECSADKELNSTYDCVSKCQEGYNRPEDTNECIPDKDYPKAKNQVNVTTEKMKNFTESSKTPKEMTSKLQERVTSKSPVDNKENSLDAGIIVGITCSVGIGILILILVVGCRWFKKGNHSRRANASKNSENSGGNQYKKAKQTDENEDEENGGNQNSENSGGNHSRQANLSKNSEKSGGFNCFNCCNKEEKHIFKGDINKLQTGLESIMEYKTNDGNNSEG